LKRLMPIYSLTAVIKKLPFICLIEMQAGNGVRVKYFRQRMLIAS